MSTVPIELNFPLTRKFSCKKNVLVRDGNRLDEYIFVRKDAEKVHSKRPKSNSNPGASAFITNPTGWFFVLDLLRQTTSGYAEENKNHIDGKLPPKAEWSKYSKRTKAKGGSHMNDRLTTCQQHLTKNTARTGYIHLEMLRARDPYRADSNRWFSDFDC